MTEIDTDKLRALDEAANEAWTEYLTLGTPHPSVALETRLRHAFMTGFCTARGQSDPAILAMAEENKRLREALHEIDIEAANTIPPDGAEAGFAALERIVRIINPFRLTSAKP